MKTEHAEALRGRIEDYLHAEGFRSDELLKVDTFISHNRDAVCVTLRAREFRCGGCRLKNPLERLFDDARNRVTKGWCDPCIALWKTQYEHEVTRTGELKKLLDRSFATRFSLPGNPVSSVLVSG